MNREILIEKRFNRLFEGGDEDDERLMRSFANIPLDIFKKHLKSVELVVRNTPFTLSRWAKFKYHLINETDYKTKIWTDEKISSMGR